MSTLDITRLVISAIVVLGFGGVVIAWLVFPPVADNTLLTVLTTALGAGYLQVLNYWFQKPNT